MTTKLVNIIYLDDLHTEYMTERIEGYLLTSGSYAWMGCAWTIQQIGLDEIITDGQQITAIYRRFDKIKVDHV